MRNGKCSLVLSDETGGDHYPVSIPTFEAFRDRPFEEIWEMVTTPKYKMDRSYVRILNAMNDDSPIIIT
jgi:hypothetical protein